MGELVANGALHLRAQHLRLVPEVALERVLIDDDAIRVDVARHGAADVVTVRALFVTAAGDDHRRTVEELADEVRALRPAGAAPFELVVEADPGADARPWEAAGATWVLTGFGRQPRESEVREAINAGP